MNDKPPPKGRYELRFVIGDYLLKRRHCRRTEAFLHRTDAHLHRQGGRTSR
jgi:hypothetical protein